MHINIKAVYHIALLGLCLVATLTGCTGMGMHEMEALKQTDFGPQETLRICVLLDEPEISQTDGAQIIKAIQGEFTLYNILIDVPVYEQWQRPGVSHMQVIENLAARKLAPPCDRILALAGRTLPDLIIGTLGITILGSVDTVTHTRGYVLSEFISLNQIVTPPEIAAIHEAYHLLGCDHDTSMNECYGRIATLKIAASKNRTQGNDFFPTYSVRGRLILRREDVDVLEAAALRVYRTSQQPTASP